MSRRSIWASRFVLGVSLSMLVQLGAPVRAPAKIYVMEVATIVPDGSAWVEQLQAFKTYVESETQGRVTVNVCAPPP